MSKRVHGTPSRLPLSVTLVLTATAVFAVTAGFAVANRVFWLSAWPNTDFSNTSIDLDEVMSGGPPKDGIASIDDPVFVPVAEADDLAPTEPVLSVEIEGDARAYPLRVLIWHEIVNDVVGGQPVAVTYCPLCNSGVVFDRVVNGVATEFGTTGNLRNSDMVMYDRETESWWQQFLGEALIGEFTGKRLKLLPARLESLSRFKARAPGGKLLVPDAAARRGASRPRRARGRWRARPG